MICCGKKLLLALAITRTGVIPSMTRSLMILNGCRDLSVSQGFWPGCDKI